MFFIICSNIRFINIPLFMILGQSLFFLVLFFTAVADASGHKLEVFSVSEIKVDETSETAAKAKDEAFAKAYELEFNEMWGSDSLLPNLNNAKFGNNKLNNTPHKFIINNKLVELYFSPSDNVTSKISNAIETAADEIDFALLAFTKDEIADAIINMAPITSKGIIEQANNTGSEYQNLINAGINVMAHYGNSPSTDHILHHKYCIIDGKDSQYANTAKILTGSHNWSAAAENYNDENTIIIHDFLIANQYFQEFTSRFNKLINNIEITESLNNIQISPNPTSGIININTEHQTNKRML